MKDTHIASVKRLQIDRTIKALEKNGMVGVHVMNKTGLMAYLNANVIEGQTVSVGGSMTLFETGVIDWLRQAPITFLDRYAPGLQPADIKAIYRQSFAADVYLTSSNALTETGHLYNVDGNGNRVAAMIYGPDKVIVVVGANKIVANDLEAIKRNETTAAPANCMRLNTKTPCKTTGTCMDCDSPERICSHYVFMRKQRIKNRIHVLILDEEYGY